MRAKKKKPTPTERHALWQARSDVDAAKKLVVSAIKNVARAGFRVERTSPSQRALRAVMDALHTADVILENEHHSALARAQKASP
jgi:hypothetical protein